MRGHGERGVAVLLVVLLINALVVSVALSIDIGRLQVVVRETQRIADVAALDAARWLASPTDTPAQLVDLVADEAMLSASRNGTVLVKDDVHIGHLQGDTWQQAVPGTASWPPTAVRVTARSHTSWLFRPGGRQVERAATAEMQPLAAFSIGSSLVSLAAQESPILGPVLGALAGDADLSVASWHSLADATLTLGDLELAASAAGFEDYLHLALGIEEHLWLMAQALSQRGLLDAATNLETIAVAVESGPLPAVSIGDLLGIDGTAGPQPTSVSLGVLDTVHGLLLLGRAGTPAIQLDLDVNIGPLAHARVEAQVTEPPRYAIGPVGTSASTAQIDLALVVEVPVAGQVRSAIEELVVPPLGGLLSTVLTPLVEALGTLRVGLALDAAASEATSTALACGAQGLSQGRFLVESRLADARLQVLGLDVPVSLAPASAVEVTVDSPYGPANGVSVSGPMPDIAHLATSALPLAVGGLTGSLLTDLLAGLLEPVTSAVVAILSPVLVNTQSQVIAPTLQALGISAANSHLVVDDVWCSSVRLVQ